MDRAVSETLRSRAGKVAGDLTLAMRGLDPPTSKFRDGAQAPDLKVRNGAPSFDAEPVIRPRFARTGWHRPGMTTQRSKRKWAAHPGGPSCHCLTQGSDRRIPGRWDQAVLVAILLDMTDRGESEVEADHRGLLGRRHVVELVA